MIMNEELSRKVRLSCQRALLGAITPNVRMISVDSASLSMFKIRVCFSEGPSDEEIDRMNAVSAEVLCDIPFESEKIECVLDTRPRKELDVLRWVVYARWEQ